jgi:hypothetical protein
MAGVRNGCIENLDRTSVSMGEQRLGKGGQQLHIRLHGDESAPGAIRLSACEPVKPRPDPRSTVTSLPVRHRRTRRISALSYSRQNSCAPTLGAITGWRVSNTRSKLRIRCLAKVPMKWPITADCSRRATRSLHRPAVLSCSEVTRGAYRPFGYSRLDALMVCLAID